MKFIVCLDDGVRDLSIPPMVILEQDCYLVELNDSDFVIDAVDADDESDARLQVADTYIFFEDELITYTESECKEAFKKERD